MTGDDGEQSDRQRDRGAEPTAETVVTEAAEAAEAVVFSRYKRSEVRDLDVTVTFEAGHLELDVYIDAPGDDEQVANDAVLAARAAVDRLFDDQPS